MKNNRVSTHELKGADSVLESMQLTAAKMRAMDNHPIWAGPHMANMVTLERDMLNLARSIFERVADSVERRAEFVRQVGIEQDPKTNSFRLGTPVPAFTQPERGSK